MSAPNQHLQKSLLQGMGLRLLFVLVGLCIDGLPGWSLKYTDIDYYVYSDAADSVWRGGSPYEIEPYRYPPFLALLLVPNHIVHSLWGKLVFVLCDVGIIYAIFACVEAFGCTRKAALYWARVWSWNPLAVVICTRGSSDSITNLGLLWCLTYLQKQKWAVAGGLYGSMVYLRLYPVIYAPLQLLFILQEPVQQLRLLLLPRGNDTAKRGHHAQFERLRSAVRASLPDAMEFTAACCLVIAWLHSVSYWLYGREYVQASYLYHFSREDHAHNFSVYWYPLYLRLAKLYCSTPAAATAAVCASPGEMPLTDAMVVAVQQSADSVFALKAALSGLQLLLVLLASARFGYSRRLLPSSLLVVTMIFVNYNRVVTAQYFTWFAVLLPVSVPTLALPEASHDDVGVGSPRGMHQPWMHYCGAALIWIVSCAYWLHEAYHLEMVGDGERRRVHVASLGCHVALTAVIAATVRLMRRFEARKGENGDG